MRNTFKIDEQALCRAGETPGVFKECAALLQQRMSRKNSPGWPVGRRTGASLVYTGASLVYTGASRLYRAPLQNRHQARRAKTQARRAASAQC